MALISLCSCGAKPPTASTWVEHETHATAVREGSAAPMKIGEPDAMDDASVKAALAHVGDEAPAAALALRAARLAHHRGDEAEARAWLARAANGADEASVHDALRALAAELAAPPVDPNVIAVLLPLSGRFAALGAELKAAIQSAPPEGTKWLFLDTRGEPDAAAAAIETALQRGAVGVLGPVGSREALVAARAAMLRELPIALLAPDDGADPASGVFRLVDSPADEGRAVARVAHADNFPTVAVLAPRDDTGADSAAAFVAEAQRLGLQVTAQGTYDPTGGDLEPDVKNFLGLVPAHNPRLAEHLKHDPKKGWQTFSPDIPFSLLYVPDRYDRAALVAAFLPYFNVELRTTEFPDPAKLAKKHGGRVPQVVQLVGGAGWHHPSLPVRGGDAVQGALIVDLCPGGAASQAHDAAMLVARARAAAASSPDPRAALRAQLARAKLDDGTCAAAAIDATGELARDPAVLEVQGDELIDAP